MPSQHFTITSPHPISLPKTVGSHGWVALEPWRWDADEGALSRTDLHSVPTAITVTQNSAHLIDVSTDGQMTDVDLLAIEKLVRRWLSLDWDPASAIEAALSVDADVADVIRQGAGRFLRSSTFYEDFLKTVCTVQINWAGTKRMVKLLIEEIGGGFAPTPTQILGAGDGGLRQRATMGFRAKGIMLSTEKLLQRGLMDAQGNAVEQALTYDVLIGLHGIGPYAASHLRMLLHDFSRVPIDSEVTKFFREQHGIGPKEIEPFLDRWGEYKFLGYRLSRRLLAS